MSFDVESCRRQFPALRRPVVYLDGPAGSQLPQRVIDAVSHYLTHTNANTGGVFATSRESDAVLAESHRAVADLLGADDAKEVAFGANMTTLTFALSRALARTWKDGDEIIVTRLDHDANVTPWVRAAQDAGVKVHHIGIRPDDCTLDLQELWSKLSKRTRLVAVGCASNACGTINPVQEIIERVHAVGGQVFLDAVHYVPHALPDVKTWNVDYLACSAYKFFGPHVGILWGKRACLSPLPTYKLRAASDELPERWMTGTQNHEGIAGTLAAVDYLADLGRQIVPSASNRRQALQAAYQAITSHERSLLQHLFQGLSRLSSYRVWGITDPARLTERVPTIAITHARRSAREVAEGLAQRNIFVWSGHFYALDLPQVLGVNGFVRIGLLHYNTTQEVDRLLAALAEIGS